MSYAQYMADLLRPLGVYNPDAPFQGGELGVAGAQLDDAQQWLEELGRESNLRTAQGWGLEQIAQLLARRPVANTPQQMGAALAALLRIGGDSFTLEAINDTIRGCGIYALVVEDGVGRVVVSFPQVPGIPPEFANISPIIEDILPAHLEIVYWFWYLTWTQVEQRFADWDDIERRALTWDQLEQYVDQSNRFTRA